MMVIIISIYLSTFLFLDDHKYPHPTIVEVRLNFGVGSSQSETGGQKGSESEEDWKSEEGIIKNEIERMSGMSEEVLKDLLNTKKREDDLDTAFSLISLFFFSYFI
jgi:hypothetical protein